ncbi:MAG: hypothetical protein JWN16_1028 [Alphaproteobacteria bacterium]|nr:hypothetical protein [Alphaproteobacteria bacterium]
MSLNRTAPARFPSVRRALLRVHADLFKIGAQMRLDLFPAQLSELEIMVLISEDRRFFRHHGFDIKSIAREMFRMLTFRRHGGASTIDMQLVRTITGYRERTASRKLYEMLLAWLIQYRYNKFEILRSYLSCAFLGSHVTGMDNAAVKVFGKARHLLSIEESARLAAMLVYPRPLTPTIVWENKIKRRANYIIRLYPKMKKRFEKLPIPEFRDRLGP